MTEEVRSKCDGDEGCTEVDNSYGDRSEFVFSWSSAGDARAREVSVGRTPTRSWRVEVTTDGAMDTSTLSVLRGFVAEGLE